MAKKVVVIGAGMAGLSAGCYARMNGFDCEIVEPHRIPGGLCTAWKRSGYTIDGCLHWLTGSALGDTFYKYWKELGAIEGRQMYDHEVFYRFHGEDGRIFSVFTDVDRLERHMVELSPGDAEHSKYFCSLVRKFVPFAMPMDKAPELYNFFDIAKMMMRLVPYMRAFGELSSVSAAGFASRFQDPLLRHGIGKLLYTEDIVLSALIITLALLHKKAGGFPIGGSLEFAKSIERRYLDLGGTIRYGQRVSKIEVEGDRAVGVLLENGTRIAADYVISGADLHATLYELLDGAHVDPRHAELFSSVKLFPSMVQVAFGTSMTLPFPEPHSLGEVYPFASPVRIGSTDQTEMLVKDFRFDPTLAPAGKQVVQVSFVDDDFEWWQKLSADASAYNAVKERVAREVMSGLDHLFPGFSDSVDMVDVVTPMTYVHYAGVYRGTFMTWIQTPENVNRLRTIPKQAPGISNLYLAGMWVQSPGGVPVGPMTARHVVQMICRKERLRFKVTEPEAQRRQERPVASM